MQKVDRATVKALELTAPGACRADFQALYGKVRSGQILGAFSERDREDIWSRVLSATVDRLVPSLFSFFEDLNYLKNVADGVKRLFPLSPDGTVSSVMEDAYSDANHRADQCVIQESESSCVARPGSLADRVDLGRRQIWMFAMRDYPQMPAVPKRKKLLTKSITGKADEIVLCEFATLAYRLGYKSEPINSLILRSADREIARSALLKARKPDRYKYNEAMFEDYVGQIAMLFSEARPITVGQASAAVEIDCSDGPPKRSGIPYALDHERDRLSLFLDKLHNTGEEQCDEMSSFFIRRSVYFAFFGKPSRPTPRSPEEVSLLDTPISVPLGDDQVREEQEQLVRQEQERLAREEQERLAREEQARLAQEEQERQERLAREEQEKLAREEQERLARAEQERLAREQESLAREEQERLAREEQERLAREEQDRLAREEQERLVREQQERLASEQERLAREEQERLARVEQERLAREEQERLVREEQERQERAALEEQERLARGEQERLEREEQERLAREEQERLAREEQERQEQAAREEQERVIREEQEQLASEQERLAREEQERLAKEEQERLARKEQERLAKEQEQLAREEQERLAREEQERLAREEQARLAREEQERLAREEQDRLAREEQERLANKEQERLAKEEQDRAEQERLAREEQERVTREEQERLVENLAKQWKDRPKQKKPDKSQPDKGSKVPRSQNGVRRGLGAAKRRERPITQFELKKVIDGESLEANYRFAPPSQEFDFSLGAAGDQVEVDEASKLASDSREQNQAVERPAREEQQKLGMEEEERPVREEQERVAHKELEKAAREEEETPATEGKERLVKNIAKQWEERIGQKIPKKTQDQRRPKVVGKGLRRGIGAAKRDRPLTQFALETLRDAGPQELIQEGRSPQTMVEDERQTTADQEVVGNPAHSTQPGTDSSATNNSSSISASGKVPDHVTNPEEQIQVVEPQVRA
jgi:hypothetical protein